MRILIAAGGTGGHIYPALAVAEVLDHDGHEISWVGSDRGIEKRVIAPKFRLYEIGMKGFSRDIANLLRMPFVIVRSLLQVNKAFGVVRPQVVFSTGGYVSVPVGIVAKLRGVPLVLHESNAIAGKSNQLLARGATMVLTAFDGVLAGDKTKTVGTPVLQDIENIAAAKAEGNTLGIVGGSLGAQVLNEQLPKALALIPIHKRPKVVHQSGRGKIFSTRLAYDRALVDADIQEYIDDMGSFYRSLTLVICRSGALTVSELTHVGLPAILVPYPHAAEDHQAANARRLVEAGAARMIPQKDMDPAHIAQEIEALMSDTALRARMAKNMQALAKKGVAKTIASFLVGLVNEEVAHA